MSAVYAFIVAEKANYGVARLCRVLGVLRSTFYAWIAGAPARAVRLAAEVALVHQIRVIHSDGRKVYGSPKVLVKLVDAGVVVNHKKVERLMAENRIVGNLRRRRVSLTKADPGAAPTPDLVKRRFTAPMPGLVTCGDITEIPTLEGKLYLATVIDLCTREVIGYAMDDNMRATLVGSALQMAYERGRLAGNAIFHSDRGAQYTSCHFRAVATDLDVRLSMGRVGSCYDNAVAEAFCAGLKTEHGTRVFATRAQARMAVFDYVEVFYNRERPHSTIGYLTPHQKRLSYSQEAAQAA